MIKPRKSPNMMSTTGRIPVIAAPTASPVKPASEIGVSITRSVPNSSTRPERTLNGVPASATSSPMMKTVGSRRISSASASRTAWPNVSWRAVSVSTALSVDILGHLARVGERSLQGELDRGADLRLDLLVDLVEPAGGRHSVRRDPLAGQLHGIACLAPPLFFFFGAVVPAVDVADVVPVEPIGVAVQERRAVARACARDRFARRAVHLPGVLSIHVDHWDAECRRSRADLTGDGLARRRVLVVQVVLADVDDGQPPERGHVHRLVQHSLAERTIAEEAHRDLVGSALLRRKRSSSRDAGRAGDDRVRAEIAALGVGDVHRTALAVAVARLLAEQLREHAVQLSALGDAVPMSAMRAGDVVVVVERGAHAHGHRLLADVEVGQPRHLAAAIQVVDLLFEMTDPEHAAIQLEGEVGIGDLRAQSLWPPAIASRALKRIAKSCFSRPSARAEVRISLTTTVVGSGTLEFLPSSIARSMSFCIMSTSNHASSGISRTNGPRYLTIGEAITLLSMTSTAVSRAIPPRSASSTPSEKAAI